MIVDTEGLLKSTLSAYDSKEKEGPTTGHRGTATAAYFDFRGPVVTLEFLLNEWA